MLLFAFLFTAAHAAWLETKHEAFDHETYIAIPLELAPLAPLRQRAEVLAGHPLKDRGEAHLTVVTPPEMKWLKPRARHRLLADLRQAKPRLEPVCLGVGKSGALKTYFVVINAPAIRKMRERAGLHSHYYPHVTLGFDERDLHEADGVRKDRRTCQEDLPGPGAIPDSGHEMPHGRDVQVAK